MYTFPSNIPFSRLVQQSDNLWRTLQSYYGDRLHFLPVDRRERLKRLAERAFDRYWRRRRAEERMLFYSRGSFSEWLDDSYGVQNSGDSARPSAGAPVLTSRAGAIVSYEEPGQAGVEASEEAEPVKVGQRGNLVFVDFLRRHARTLHRRWYFNALERRNLFHASWLRSHPRLS